MRLRSQTLRQKVKRMKKSKGFWLFGKIASVAFLVMAVVSWIQGDVIWTVGGFVLSKLYDMHADMMKPND